MRNVGDFLKERQTESSPELRTKWEEIEQLYVNKYVTCFAFKLVKSCVDAECDNTSVKLVESCKISVQCWICSFGKEKHCLLSTSCFRFSNLTCVNFIHMFVWLLIKRLKVHFAITCSMS